MFGNNDNTEALKAISKEIDIFKNELDSIKENHAREIEMLNNVLEGLRHVYRVETECLSMLKEITDTPNKEPIYISNVSGANSSLAKNDVSSIPTDIKSDESLTDKFNRVINSITSLEDMPNDFKNIGLSFDGNKLVPVNGRDLYFIAEYKDNEHYLYPSVQVKERRGQEITDGEFNYMVNGTSSITVKSPCKLLKFDYGYKVLEKGVVQID